MEGICLELEGKSGLHGPNSILDCTNPDGKYEMEGMPPGRYRIVVNRHRDVLTSPAIYYPGAVDISKASIVIVPEGGQLESVDIDFPPSNIMTWLLSTVLLGLIVRAIYNSMSAGLRH
jgi:hypothetical protein